MRFSAQWAVEVCAGTLIGPQTECVGASFDSRELRPGEMFVAVEGVRDGHEFVGTAIAGGASSCLVSSAWATNSAAQFPTGTFVVVEDTVAALGAIAAAVREQFSGAVVGGTG
jgi:UDP-N-acetylmuramoyl-tripeptide--D-alanyl-D-alanine ligase